VTTTGAVGAIAAGPTDAGPPADAASGAASTAPPVALDAAPVAAPTRSRRPPSRGGEASPPPAEAPRGTLVVSSSPWAAVTVIGRSERCADTPCRLSLPAGTYTVRLENAIERVGAMKSVTIEAGGETTLVEMLTRPL
jgi:hypothetical protein